jgi:hypothetical protein
MNRRQSSPLIPVLPDQILGGDQDPSTRFLALLGGALPEIGAARAQHFFQDGAVLGLGAAAVLGGAALQRVDDVERYVSNQ